MLMGLTELQMLNNIFSHILQYNTYDTRYENHGHKSCVHLGRVAGNTVWSHMASDAP